MGQTRNILLGILVILACTVEACYAAGHNSGVTGISTGGDKPAAKPVQTGSRVHELYAWGLNSVGQLGLVDFQDRKRPTLVSVLQGKNVTSISMGGSDQVDSHTLIIVSPGKLFATGDNTYGQLGLGDNTDRESFIPVRTVFSETFIQVATGESHSVALTTKGNVYVWGNNMRSQLALDDGTAQTNVPRLLQLPMNGDKDKVVGVAAGIWHTVVWTSSGAVYSCGDNSYGQLGVGDKRAHGDIASVPGAPHGIVKVEVPSGVVPKLVVCGGHHNILLAENGALYSWGRAGLGQLGLQNADITKDYTKPMLIPKFTDEKVVAVSLGFTHSAVTTAEGKVYMFGDNSNGQLGMITAGDSKTADAKFSHHPHAIMPSSRFRGVACGRYHTMLLTDTGKVYTAGTNMNGQLGMGDMASRPTPQLVQKLNGHRFVQVVAGALSSMGITDIGDLYGWGRNNVGQLGIRRSKNSKLNPEFIMSARDSSYMSQVVGGGYAYQYEGHSMVLMGTGEVFSWGWNAFGQLGVGEVEEAQSIPQKNSWLFKADIKQIAAGQFASAAVTADGEVFTWGQNEAGQLGKGDFNSGPVDIPQKIHVDASISHVAIGYSHMLGLSLEGHVYSWGHNFYGQLGVGDHKDKNTPQLISYLQDDRIGQVVAGQYHSLAVSIHGEIYGWGYNRDYELGVGDNMDRVLPQAIPALVGRKITEVAAGGYHVLAISDDGTLFSWGMNNFGQLGHRERSTSKVPTVVTVTANNDNGAQTGKRLRVTAVAAGTWHSVVLAENNAVYTFGRCQYGQLGTKCQSGDRNQDAFTPERVTENLEGKKVVGIAAGAAHTFAIVSNNVRFDAATPRSTD